MTALHVLFQEGPPPGVVTAALVRAGLEVAGGGGVGGAGFGVRVDGVSAEVVVVDEALADPGLDEAAGRASAGVAEAARHHRAHARVAALGDEESALQRIEALTRVAAALLEVPGALALYDPAGAVLSDGAGARRRVAGPAGPPPLDLWVGLRTFELADASGWFLDTLGMAQLGLPDLEAYAAEGPATAQVAAWLRNLGLYLVQEEARARLRHGDTLDGPDEQPWVTLEDVATAPPARKVLRFMPLQRAGR